MSLRYDVCEPQTQLMWLRRWKPFYRERINRAAGFAARVFFSSFNHVRSASSCPLVRSRPSQAGAARIGAISAVQQSSTGCSFHWNEPIFSRRKNGAMLQLLINVLTLRILGWTRAANINVPCNLAWVNRDIGACCCYQLFRVRYIGMIAVHAQCTRSMCSQVGHLAASAICLLPIEHLWDLGNHTWRAAITASLYFYIGHDQPWFQVPVFVSSSSSGH